MTLTFEDVANSYYSLTEVIDLNSGKSTWTLRDSNKIWWENEVRSGEWEMTGSAWNPTGDNSLALM